MASLLSVYGRRVIRHFSNPRSVGATENLDCVGYVVDPSRVLIMKVSQCREVNGVLKPAINAY